jgi:hypothetical protein
MNQKLGMKILKQLGIGQVEDLKSAFEIVVTSLAIISKAMNIQDVRTLLNTVNFPLLKSLESLDKRDILCLEDLITKRAITVTSQDIYDAQIKVQRLINPLERKKLAAYYTKPIGLKLMTKILSEYIKIHRRPVIISDPFLGSGLTLSEPAKELPHSDIQKIWGIEPHALSALVAYAAILYSMRGDHQKVDVTVGDAFKIVCQKLPSLMHFTRPLKDIIPANARANVILTNPPFTRWELLDKNYRDFLTKLIHFLGYGKYVKRRQLNLQLISLFLMDYFLYEDGLLISVLPASTFYTLCGEAAKTLLHDRYCVHALVEFDHEPSFSIDSGFKEVILVASKRQTVADTAFATLEASAEIQVEQLAGVLRGNKPMNSWINWVNIHDIPSFWEMNWLALFGENQLREQLSRVFTVGTRNKVVDIWKNAFHEKRIVRGIEMYGPDFFFIPNRYWRLTGEDEEKIIIGKYDSKEKIEIHRDFLVPALRRPELYAKTIVPDVEHYFLSIPPKPREELPSEIVKYIEWGEKSSSAKPAIRAFGKYWYSHVHKQIKVKKPFGRVFIPDKIDPSFRRRSVFACYSDDYFTASKNFYIATFENKLKDKTISAWFNSTPFIAYFIVASRKISERWTRFLEEDYLRMPVINVNLLDEEALSKVGRCLDNIAERKLPPLHLQLDEDYRLELDETLLDIMGVKDSRNVCEQLYSMLKRFFTRGLEAKADE